MAERLEKLTNVAVIVACVVVSSAVVSNYFTQSNARRPLATSGYERGERMDQIAGAPDSSERSLYLIVRSTCRYCTESMPFYRRLREARDRANSRTRLVVVCPESRVVCEKYVLDHDFKADVVASTKPETLKAKGTPTLVLVDSAGRVSEIWVGRLEESRESEVVKAVLSTSS